MERGFTGIVMQQTHADNSVHGIQPQDLFSQSNRVESTPTTPKIGSCLDSIHDVLATSPSNHERDDWNSLLSIGDWLTNDLESFWMRIEEIDEDGLRYPSVSNAIVLNTSSRVGSVVAVLQLVRPTCSFSSYFEVSSQGTSSRYLHTSGMDAVSS